MTIVSPSTTRTTTAVSVSPIGAVPSNGSGVASDGVGLGGRDVGVATAVIVGSGVGVGAAVASAINAGRGVATGADVSVEVAGITTLSRMKTTPNDAAHVAGSGVVLNRVLS